MDNAATQGCWICGKEDSERCSACAKAGINIFFCSSEHQRLVWPIHKLFCGPGKANPFTLPPLSPEEAVEVRRNAGKSIALSSESAKGMLLANLLQYGLKPADIFSVEQTLQFANSSNPDKWISRQLCLAVIRFRQVDLRNLEDSEDDQGDPLPSPAAFALGEVSRFIAIYLKTPYTDLGPFSPPHPSFLTPLLHRVAMQYYLAALMAQKSPPGVGAVWTKTSDLLRHFVEAEVTPVQPKLGGILHAALHIETGARVAGWLKGPRAVDEYWTKMKAEARS
ncbi:hypothetical protein JCM8097_004152 [Rhodosporidiobolus ruineniae]